MKRWTWALLALLAGNNLTSTAAHAQDPCPEMISVPRCPGGAWFGLRGDGANVGQGQSIQVACEAELVYVEFFFRLQGSNQGVPPIGAGDPLHMTVFQGTTALATATVPMPFDAGQGWVRFPFESLSLQPGQYLLAAYTNVPRQMALATCSDEYPGGNRYDSLNGLAGPWTSLALPVDAVFRVQLDTPLPVVDIVASDESPLQGDEVLLTVSIADAVSATLTPGFGSISPVDGTYPVTPLETTTYVLTGTNEFGSRSSEVTISPRVTLPVVGLSASNETPFPGESVNLFVSIADAASATLSPGFGSIPPTDAIYPVIPAGTTTYVLTAQNAFGTTSSEVTLSPVAPRIDAFFADPPVTLSGFSVGVEWDVAGADQIQIEPLALTTADAAGRVIDQPESTTTYTLTATNAAGISTATAQVDVVPFIITRFEATPDDILPGEPATLSWRVIGTASVEVAGLGSQPLVGAIHVFPQTTTIYTLTATSGGVTDSREVIVQVAGKPLVSFSWAPDAIPGTRPSLEPLTPFDVYVVVLEGNGIRESEFQVAHSPCLVVVSETLFGENPQNVGTSGASVRNYLVDAGSCLAGTITPLVRLGALFFDETCLDTGLFQIGPVIPSSFDPASAGHVDCQGESIPFDDGPFTTLPLQDPVVSAVVVALDASSVQTGIQLSWSIQGAGEVEEVTVLRSPAERDGLPIVLDQLEGEQGVFLDDTAFPGVDYVYTLTASLDQGTVTSSEVRARWADAPGRSRLLGNVPNPFNPQTEIRFELAQPGPVQLEIVDAAGRRVRWVELTLGAGARSWVWDGRDGDGRGVSSGVYYVRLSLNGDTDVRRMALVR